VGWSLKASFTAFQPVGWWKMDPVPVHQPSCHSLVIQLSSLPSFSVASCAGLASPVAEIAPLSWYILGLLGFRCSGLVFFDQGFLLLVS
jgi:hypothetical protein